MLKRYETIRDANARLEEGETLALYIDADTQRDLFNLFGSVANTNG